ncbi:tRNA lysidine(34) synthetase TilS [Garciella nitratireducens]|uniref:tRNA lysidine(34) synthetase TilS n=1 Tax=Garciella nitratireducens TaxID=218205 RepID=UPI001BD58329|nr:tRNA lysidine(34) synthetase TilS [Garciella nitratireducens]
MREKVLRYIEKNHMIEKEEGILVAVSGGPDSICLLHILKWIKEFYSLHLVVVHVNHMLRGENACKDERYVQEVCESWKIPCYIYRADIKKLSQEERLSIEEAGRKARYEYFFYMKEKLQLQKIALGQHGDDNAETILMRILRGTGPKGLSGISPYRKDGVIRPLLCCSRDEIVEYCNFYGLFPRIDTSNLKPIYFRNKIRLELIPYLEQYNRNLKLHLRNLGEMMREQQEYIDNEMEKLWRKNAKIDNDSVIFFYDFFKYSSTFVQKEMLKKSISWIKSNLKEISFVHMQSFVEMIKNEKNTIWTLEFPQEIKIQRQYEKLLIKKEQKKEKIIFEYPLVIGERIFIPEIHMEFYVCLENKEKADIIKSNSTNKVHFDFEKVGKSLFIRNRRPGDIFKPLGGNGTKKLKDYFIDLKIPRDKRDEIPIIVNEKGVIWPVGYRPDKRYIVDERTKMVLTIEYRDRKEEQDDNHE